VYVNPGIGAGDVTVTVPVGTAQVGIMPLVIGVGGVAGCALTVSGVVSDIQPFTVEVTV
jgi:hypothetical protein